MLILSKSILGLMLGFILSLISAFIIIPILRSLKLGQPVSKLINIRHMDKNGTPTIGGLIFIIPTLIIIFMLYLRDSITLNANLGILLLVFISFAVIGFIDDYIKIKKKENTGLESLTKLIFQTVIAVIFYIIFIKSGAESTLTITFLNINIPLGWAFSFFIFMVLVGTTNAVNITDGLDGLAGGLSVMAFLAYGVIAWGSPHIAGHEELAIFSFVLVGTLLGFLVFNTHPARVFMGDTGSLALGSALGTLAILTRHELSLVLIGGVFVIETISSLIQIIAIRKYDKKVFLKAPLHHHFEELNWKETDIVKLFWVVGFILAMLGIIYGVWI